MLKAALASGAVSALTGAGALALVPGSAEVVEGIPNRALVAYVNAAQTAPCPVDWWDIAAVGVAESGHGTHGGAHITEDGTLSKPIGSSVGAQGPMQFMDTYEIPTWSSYVAMGYGDGDGDGVHDINDVDDAANGTAAYLCRSGYVKGDPAAIQNAWGAYNGGANWRRYGESQAYVVICRRFADAYSGAQVPELPAPSGAGSVAAVGPVGAPVEVVKIERTPKRLALNVWGRIVKGWVALGGSSDPEVQKRWADVDKGLFGVEPASQPGQVPSP